MSFGREHRSLSTAAVAFEPDYRNASRWTQYLALHRSGVLEAGLSRGGARLDEQRGVFFLVSLVGHIWIMASLHTEVVERYGIPGPYRVVLGLRGTENTQLGNMAAGWLDPAVNRFETEHLPRCLEANVLLTVEFQQWPTGSEESVAFKLGDLIESAWGSGERRFIAKRGEHAGGFDPAAYANFW